MPVYKFLQSSQQEVVGNVGTDDISDGAVTRAKLSSDIQTQLDTLSATGIETLDLTVYGYSNTVFDIVSNASRCVRQGAIVFVTLEIVFTVPVAQNLTAIHGLPFVVNSPAFATIGVINRNSTGDKAHVSIRPVLDAGVVEYGAFQLWVSDAPGTNYPIPVAGEDYSVYAEFFYFTDGGTTYADYLAQVESETNYIAKLTSSNFYQTVI